MSLTMLSTIFWNAPPMTTPIARSKTLPFMANSLNSDIIDMQTPHGGVDGPSRPY